MSLSEKTGYKSKVDDKFTTSFYDKDFEQDVVGGTTKGKTFPVYQYTSRQLANTSAGSTNYSTYGSTTSSPGPANTYIDYKFINIKDFKTILAPDGATNNKKNKLTNVLDNYINVSPLNDYDYQTYGTDEEHHVLKNYKDKTPSVYKSTKAGFDALQKTQMFFQFSLTLKNNSENKNTLVSQFKQTYQIMNASPYSFREGDNVRRLNQISVYKETLEAILQQFFIRFEELTKDREKDDDKIQQRIFNNVDDDIIKLNIYRTLSSINDKWLGGETKNLPCTNISKIVDSFRFLDSGFLDIGDDFLINPLSISQKMVSNYNQSFFDLINSILIENNFNFIALPSFIDFTTAKKMKEDVFTPIPWSAGISKDTTGAQFVCVYVGQKSSNLNLGNDSDHEDDGFTIVSDGKCDDENGIMANTQGAIPEIFQNNTKQKGYKIPYFLVSYGKGNQSIFKDIKLDQREFTETAESLEIINDLSDSADKSKTSYKGQNLFNTYQKRAYSAEVEMMGNVTIQPMMYFQLNNIPMFKGAYLIHNTTHSITAHNMKTTFKGSRIKKVKTPLITEVQIFQSLIGSLSDVGKAKNVSNKNLTFKTPLTPPKTSKSNVIKISR